MVEGPRRPDDTGDVESHTDVVFDAAGEPVETVVCGESPAVAIESILLSFLGGVSKSTCNRVTFVACGVVLLMGASRVAFNAFCVSFMSTIAARCTVHNPSGTPSPWARPSTEPKPNSGQDLSQNGYVLLCETRDNTDPAISVQTAFRYGFTKRAETRPGTANRAMSI